MPRTRASTGRQRGSSAPRASAATPQRRRESIARDDSTLVKDRWGSLRFVLSGKFSKRLFGFLHVVKCEFSRFHQVRHNQPGAAAEYCQQIINQTALRILAGDDCLEDVGFADALGKAKGLFPLQPIYDRLYSRVGRPVRLRKGLLNLSDGASAILPEGL